MKKIVSTNTGVFVRGSFNNWSLDNEMSRCKDGSYVAKNIMFKEGVNELKIANNDWNGLNYGYDGQKPGMFCFNYPMTENSNNNLRITVAKDTLVDVYFYKSVDSVFVRLKVSAKR